MAADAGTVVIKPDGADADCGVGSGADQGQSFGMARLDEAAQAFVDDPAGRVAVAFRQPAGGGVVGEGGMVFADVVEVVGDGGADVGRGVVVE